MRSIGAGAAGLQLLLKMIRDPFFKEKSILVLDKDEKSTNDRVWCFWELDETKWGQIATKTWSQGLFINPEQTLDFDLEPYRYKMVRSANFYLHTKGELAKAENVKWVKDEMVEVNDQDIKGSSVNYHADHIFDSRIPPTFHVKQDDYHSLIQHFKGWLDR